MARTFAVSSIVVTVGSAVTAIVFSYLAAGGGRIVVGLTTAIVVRRACATGTIRSGANTATRACAAARVLRVASATEALEARRTAVARLIVGIHTTTVTISGASCAATAHIIQKANEVCVIRVALFSIRSEGSTAHVFGMETSALTSIWRRAIHAPVRFNESKGTEDSCRPLFLPPPLPLLPSNSLAPSLKLPNQHPRPHVNLPVCHVSLESSSERGQILRCDSSSIPKVWTGGVGTTKEIREGIYLQPQNIIHTSPFYLSTK